MENVYLQRVSIQTTLNYSIDEDISFTLFLILITKIYFFNWAHRNEINIYTFWRLESLERLELNRRQKDYLINFDVNNSFGVTLKRIFSLDISWIPAV